MAKDLIPSNRQPRDYSRGSDRRGVDLSILAEYLSAATDDLGAMTENTSTELVDLVSMKEDSSTVAFHHGISTGDPDTVKSRL